MPFQKKTILVPFADVPGKGGLTKAIDVDDGDREVPVNMNFEGEAFLTKDSGAVAMEAVGDAIVRQLFSFTKKSGTAYSLALVGTHLRKASGAAWVALQAESAALAGTAATTAPTAGTGTITAVGTAVTGVGTNFTGQLTANVSFIIVGGKSRQVTAIADATHLTIEAAFDADFSASAFTLSSQIIVGTSTAFTTDLLVGQVIRVGSEVFYVRAITDATHVVVNSAPAATASGLSYYKDSEPTFSATATMGSVPYLDTFYFGNGVEDFGTFDGTRILFYKNLPRGNVYEIYKDRLFIAGVTREPLSGYYSNAAAATTFGATQVFQPVGTDHITGLITFYDTLIVFKRRSAWKFVFTYDPIAVAFLPQFDIVDGNYGCAGVRAYGWTQNEVWFFTGEEVRSVGYKDQQFGVLGVNAAVLSDQIKETLKTVNPDYAQNAVVGYANRRFYLAVPVGTAVTNDHIFVCHLLYSRAWTKYVDRPKADVSDLLAVNETMYSSSATVVGAAYTWSDAVFEDAGTGYEFYVIFRRYEDRDFSARKVWRFWDLQFRNIEGNVRADVFADDFDIRTGKTKTFFLGTQSEGEDNPLGEVDYGESLYGDAYGESVVSANFLNRRLSFLSKSQALTLKLGGASTDDNFSVVQTILEGYAQPRRQFATTKIASLS